MLDSWTVDDAERRHVRQTHHSPMSQDQRPCPLRRIGEIAWEELGFGLDHVAPVRETFRMSLPVVEQLPHLDHA
jgi:hypothetical protein